MTTEEETEQVTRAAIRFDASVARGMGLVLAYSDPAFARRYAEMAYYVPGGTSLTAGAYRRYARLCMHRLGIEGSEHDKFGALHEYLVDAVSDLLAVALNFGLEPDDVMGTALGHVYEEWGSKCP